MSVLRRVLVGCALLAAGACDKKAEVPSGLPPLQQGAATPNPAAEQAVHPPTGANGTAQEEGLPAGHPQLPPGHVPVASGQGGPPIVGETPGGALDPTKTLAGQLVLDPKIKDKVSAGDVIFLVARTDDGTDHGGPILGVKRLTAGAWPQPFELDGRDAMQPGTKFEGKVMVSARVDKDGDAISKNPGDAIGVAHVTIPAKNVRLSIDTITQ
jgi:hypothetical protein